MNSSKFWSPKDLLQSKKLSSQSGDIPSMPSINLGETQNSTPALKAVKKSKVGKKLGITGLIFLIVALILGLVSYIFLIRPAVTLVNSASVLKKDLNNISASLQARDMVALNLTLDEMDMHLKKIKEDRDSRFGWAKDVSFAKLGEFYSDSDRFINAAFIGISAMKEMSQIISPFADAAGLKVLPDQVVPESAGLMEAFQTWVSIMPDVAGQMDGVIVKMSQIGDELAPIDVSKYPKTFRDIQVRDNIAFVKNTLSGAKDFAPDIKEALTIIPGLLGVDSPIAKRYFIIFQNDKELRPTGGFWTYFATFRLKDGLLQSDFTSYNFYAIDDILDIIDATYDFPDAPAVYTKYLKVERWYARDTNSSPDLPTSIDQLLFYYNLASRIDPATIKPIDGIVVIDTRVLEELLGVTGPVTVNGVTYTTENVVLELEKIASLALREQANRKRVLGDLMEEMLINVFESDKNLWSKIIEKGVDLSARKHIATYSFDPKAQALIEKYNLGGRIWDNVEGDYSMVVSTNLGGDKTNWFTTKKVDHKLTKEDGKWIDTVDITYNYKQPSADFDPFVKRFRDWVRVYAPKGSTLISTTGSEDESVNLSAEERNKVYFSGFLELGPNETKTITFKYALPDGVVGEKYMLNLQKQAGITSEIHTVSINGKMVEEINLDRDVKKSYTL